MDSIELGQYLNAGGIIRGRVESLKKCHRGKPGFSKEQKIDFYREEIVACHELIKELENEV